MSSSADSSRSSLRTFILPPESLAETYNGYPALYNPPGVLSNQRNYPSQRESLMSSDSDMYAQIEESTIELSFWSVVNNTVKDIMHHPYTIYWIGLLAISLTLNLGVYFIGILCFLMGYLGRSILSTVFAEEDYSSQRGSLEEPYSDKRMGRKSKDRNENSTAESEKSLRAQGWMLTYPLDTSYSVSNHKLRNTLPIFVRLTGPTMVISHPHPKHHIPKRRLWSDPEIQLQHIFLRHEQYNMTRAKIEVVPDRLAKNRVWCKKYPIAVTVSCKDILVDNQAETGVDLEPTTGGTKMKDKGGKVLKDGCTRVLYLFSRTDREKDDWFRRLVQASNCGLPKPRESKNKDFFAYMTKACPTLSRGPRDSHGYNRLSRASKRFAHEKLYATPGEVNPAFLNALLARILYDILKSPKWADEIRTLINKKLHSIRKPPFVESLSVKELDLGGSPPTVKGASAPLVDHQGLWADFEIMYSGDLSITIETYVNLLKLGEDDKASKSSPKKSKPKNRRLSDPETFDSGESSESSEDEEMSKKPKPAPEKKTEGKMGKLLRYADTIVNSAVMRNKHVRKVVGSIAATPILLSVEIKRVEGLLAFNIPPVPTNRIWIGFRSNPNIQINARPQFGERALTLSHLTEWIKRKLLLEVERMVVCPNMFDISVPLMEFSLPK